MSTLRKVVRKAVPATAALAGLGVTAAMVPANSIDGGAAAWASGLSANERSSYLVQESLAELPGPYRKALIHSARSLEERVGIWRAALDSYRESRSLSPAQEAILAKVGSYLTPQNFDMAKDLEKKREAVNSLLAEVRQNLGEDAVEQLFYWAGPERASGANLAFKERMLLQARRANPLRLTVAVGYLMPALSAADCNCADDGDCSYFQTCSSPYACREWGVDPVYPFPIACGPWNFYDCVKLCSYDS